MDNRAEVREFLTTRRAKISPQQAGLPAGGQRRVPGLRRSEVAALAGMSVEYYAKLERGTLAGVSPGVLDAIARTLRLDDAERAHLMRLAHEADGSNAVLRPPRRPKQWQVRPFDLAADMIVANLRTAAGKDAHDNGLHDLVGELSTRSDDFRRRWGAHNVRTHGTGVKTFHHHAVGDLELAYESMDLRADPDLTMTLYAAQPASPTEDALRLLASWAAAQQTDGAGERLTTR